MAYYQLVEIYDERSGVIPNIDPGNLQRANLEYAIPYGIYKGPGEQMDNALALIGDSAPKVLKVVVAHYT